MLLLLLIVCTKKCKIYKNIFIVSTMYSVQYNNITNE